MANAGSGRIAFVADRRRLEPPPRQRTALDRLVRALDGRTDVAVTRQPDGLRIEPRGSSGFPISLHVLDDGCYADFGGCGQEFDDPEGACRWIERALSADYRLRIELWGNVPCRWSLEPSRADGGALTLSSGRPRPWTWLWPFSRKPQVVERAYAWAANDVGARRHEQRAVGRDSAAGRDGDAPANRAEVDHAKRDLGRAGRRSL